MKPKDPASQKWRREYIRLLTQGPKPDRPEESKSELQEELDLMRELIDDGYATGQCLKDQNGVVTAAIWEGPTTRGRLFADDLQEYLDQRTKRHQLSVAMTASLGWLAGIASALLTTWLTK